MRTSGLYSSSVHLPDAARAERNKTDKKFRKHTKEFKVKTLPKKKIKLKLPVGGTSEKK
jgi:hypothetical protein